MPSKTQKRPQPSATATPAPVTLPPAADAVPQVTPDAATVLAIGRLANADPSTLATAAVLATAANADASGDLPPYGPALIVDALRPLSPSGRTAVQANAVTAIAVGPDARAVGTVAAAVTAALSVPRVQKVTAQPIDPAAYAADRATVLAAALLAHVGDGAADPGHPWHAVYAATLPRVSALSDAQGAALSRVLVVIGGRVTNAGNGAPVTRVQVTRRAMATLAGRPLFATFGGTVHQATVGADGAIVLADGRRFPQGRPGTTPTTAAAMALNGGTNVRGPDAWHVDAADGPTVDAALRD